MLYDVYLDINEYKIAKRYKIEKNKIANKYEMPKKEKLNSKKKK